MSALTWGDDKRFTSFEYFGSRAFTSDQWERMALREWTRWVNEIVKRRPDRQRMVRACEGFNWKTLDFSTNCHLCLDEQTHRVLVEDRKARCATAWMKTKVRESRMAQLAYWCWGVPDGLV